MAVEIVNDANYREFRSSEPAALFFRLSYCGHCIRFTPTFERLSEALPDVRFGRVNVDTDSNLTVVQREFRPIFQQGLFPTTAVFREGKSPVYFTGAYTFEDAREIFDDILRSDEDLPGSLYARLNIIKSDDIKKASPVPNRQTGHRWRFYPFKSS